MNLDILNSPWFRPLVFINCFLVLCFFEVITPKRTLSSSKKKRWFSNLSLSLFNTLFIKIVFPFSLTVIAAKAQSINMGLFNWINTPVFLEVALCLIIFDFFIYVQHIATHKYLFLWKLHQVHHADIDLDVSSGNRFHTNEIILSFLYKSVLILLIGPMPESVILFKILLNSMAMFNHSNINIPAKVDNVLRIFVVTPDMHRIHHSIDNREFNTNFGFNLSIWDFLFKTYKGTPTLGHLKMKIGLPYFRQDKYISPISLIKMPFLKNDEK